MNDRFRSVAEESTGEVTDRGKASRAVLRRAILPCLIGGGLLYVAAWLAAPGLYAWAVLGVAPVQIAVGGIGLWRDPSSELAPLRVALLGMAAMAVARWLVLPWS